VDFDMNFGHRRDIKGYADAVMHFDAWLADFMPRMREDDLLIITADHGCDPGFKGTDHTRENVPLLVYGKGVKPQNLGRRDSYADIAETIADNFETESSGFGKSFLNEIRKG
jgi:phosphopentomutase